MTPSVFFTLINKITDFLTKTRMKLCNELVYIINNITKIKSVQKGRRFTKTPSVPFPNIIISKNCQSRLQYPIIRHELRKSYTLSGQ